MDVESDFICAAYIKNAFLIPRCNNIKWSIFDPYIRSKEDNGSVGHDKVADYFWCKCLEVHFV